MFYHVSKGQKEKDDKKHRRERSHKQHSDLDNLSPDMEPGLFARSLHKDRARSRSPRPGSGRSRSRARDSVLESEIGDYKGDEYASDMYPSDDDDDESIDDFIHVPKCMLGQPLKDYKSGQDNVSNLYVFLHLYNNVFVFLPLKRVLSS